MKRKPDVLVILAALLGLGMVVSSIGHAGSVAPQETVVPVTQLP